MGPLNQLFADPIVQSVVAPLLVAAILTGLLGFGFGRTLGPRIAAAAIPVGFLVSYWATVGWPSFPPVASNQKIAYIVLLGVIFGTMVDLFRENARQVQIGMVVWPAVIVCWLGVKILFPKSDGGLGWIIIDRPAPVDMAVGVALWVAGTAVLLGLRESRGGSEHKGAMLLIAAVGVSFIGLIGSSASFAQLSGGLAAATGGFLLWNWPKNRFLFGWTAMFGGAGALLSIVSAMVLFTNASKLALLLILPVFFADRLAARLPLAGNPALAPFMLAAVCLVPVALAVLVAYLSSGGGSGYAFNMEVSH